MNNMQLAALRILQNPWCAVFPTMQTPAEFWTEVARGTMGVATPRAQGEAPKESTHEQKLWAHAA